MSIFGTQYDTIVIGGGLAGVHAAKKTAARGRALLVTSSWDTVASLSRGPAFRGARLDIETEGMAFAKNRLQHASLCQAAQGKISCFSVDVDKYQEGWQVALERAKLLTIYQDTVEQITAVAGGWRVGSRWGVSFTAAKIVLAVGTFLGGIVRIGDREIAAGRPGELGAIELERAVTELGPALVSETRRASPTIRAASLDWTQLRRLRGGDNLLPLHETETADGRQIILVPVNGREQQLYPYVTEDRLGAVDEQSLRGARGFGEAVMITPGYEVTFKRLASGQIDARGEYAGAPGLHFAGSVAGLADYGDSIRSGIMAGTRAKVSRET